MNRFDEVIRCHGAGHLHRHGYGITVFREWRQFEFYAIFFNVLVATEYICDGLNDRNRRSLQ